MRTVSKICVDFYFKKWYVFSVIILKVICFMEDFLFETKTVLTYDLYKKYNFEVMKKSKLVVILIIYEVVMVALAIAAVVLKKYSFLIEAIILFIIVPLLTYLVRVRAIKRLYNSCKTTINQEYVIRFYPDCLIKTSENSSATIKYNQIYKIIETKENFYIMISTNQGMPVVKNNCSPELIEFIRKLKK